MKTSGQEIGQSGEMLAADYLSRKGYTLLERNFRCSSAEIDIIAKDGDCLCFIEVKTRTSLRKGLPKESVHHTKQQKLISGATFYLKKKKLSNLRVRFDVVEIMITHDTPAITLIKNAFGLG